MEVEDVETCTRAVITVVDESFTLGSNRSHHRGPTATIVVISYVFSVRLRPVTSSATRVANGEKRGKRWYRAWWGGSDFLPQRERCRIQRTAVDIYLFRMEGEVFTCEKTFSTLVKQFSRLD